VSGVNFTNKFEKRIEVYEDEFDDDNLIFVDILNSIQFEMLTGREREMYDEEVRHKQAEIQQREEGRKEGRKELKEEIARKGLEMGLSEKQIQELLKVKTFRSPKFILDERSPKINLGLRMPRSMPF
jgi:flagellar biosynthesis/type III secretory pathway protein FliH